MFGMRNKMLMSGTFENSEFAQMPHKGTPIRYEQKQPVRNRQQGAGKVSPRRIWVICKQETFSATPQLG
jgi:hypothetical protein